MALSDAKGQSEAPLYVRWGPSGSPYAIELKLDLVATIRETLQTVTNANAEIGGVLVGSLPSSYSPTLRVEDVEFIPREDKDGLTFMLGPSDETTLEEARLRAREVGRSVVGLFRSHRRPGALRPSLADRGLISSLFTEAVCVLLLVEASEPFSAAFFIAQNRQLPADPSVREFKFDERDFKLLPELEPEPPPSRRPPEEIIPKRRKSLLPVWIGVGVLAIASAWYLFWGQSQFALALPFLRPAQLNLTVIREGPGLRVSWDHSATAFDHASGARLTVRRPGGQNRDVQLGLDELRLGALEIENQAPRVEVILTVEVPGSAPIRQYAAWGR